MNLYTKKGTEKREREREREKATYNYIMIRLFIYKNPNYLKLYAFEENTFEIKRFMADT